MSAAIGPFWFGENKQEVIIITGGLYALLENNTRRSQYIGGSIIEARKRLKELGKGENFPDFMKE